MSTMGVRRGKAALSSGCKSHPANSLPPEAIGAVMEVTKWLKPSISVSRIGDSASGQAVTRVNAEQASHDAVQVKGPHQGSIKKLRLLRHPRSEPDLNDAARFPSTINLTYGRRS
jgi:hypothetical protein